MGLRVDIITIFPEYFDGPLDASLIGKAAQRGDIDFHVHDLRRWAPDVHHTVDDVPFGGGPGMVMKPDVWGAALDEVTGLGPDQPKLPDQPELRRDLAPVAACDRHVTDGVVVQPDLVGDRVQIRTGEHRISPTLQLHAISRIQQLIVAPILGEKQLRGSDVGALVG